MPKDLAVQSSILTNKVKGWTTIPNDGNMDPAFAPTFQNILLTRQGAIQKRFGHERVNSAAVTGGVEINSILEWCPSSVGDSCQILLGTADGSLFRLETDNTVTAIHTGLTGGTKLRGVNFRGKLYIGNGTDTPIFYDGTSTTLWDLGDGTAAGTATIGAGTDITSISVDTAGLRYFGGATVTITGDGAGATATADVDSSGALTAINMTAGGTGYTTATVTITTFGTVPKFKYIHAHEGRLAVSGGTDLDLMVAKHSSLDDAFDWRQLDPDTNPTTGFAIDLAGTLPFGDELVSINSQDGFIIYYCKNHIVIYSLSTDVRTFSLIKVLRGQGCIAPGGQEIVGDDAYFWARYGVKSLTESLNTDTLELGKDISEPIDNELTDRLQAIVDNSLQENVSFVNYQKRSMVILNYPTDTDSNTYVQAAYNYRFKVWSEWTNQNFNDIFVSSAGVLYGAGQDGFLYQMDKSNSDNTAAIPFKWETPWLFLGNNARIKDMDCADVVIANDDEVNFNVKWYFDFIKADSTENISTWTAPGGGPYFVESGIDPIFVFDGLWTGSGKSSPPPFPLFGYGLTIKFIFENTEVNAPFTFEYLRLDYNIGSRASGR